MKLYTEEQVRETISNTLRIINSEKTWTYDDVINLLRPIELPSDEEIEEGLFHQSNEYAYGYKDAFKWMRNKIQRGNK